MQANGKCMWLSMLYDGISTFGRGSQVARVGKTRAIRGKGLKEYGGQSQGILQVINEVYGELFRNAVDKYQQQSAQQNQGK